MWTAVALGSLSAIFLSARILCHDGYIVVDREQGWCCLGLGGDGFPAASRMALGILA